VLYIDGGNPEVWIFADKAERMGGGCSKIKVRRSEVGCL